MKDDGATERWIEVCGSLEAQSPVYDHITNNSRPDDVELDLSICVSGIQRTPHCLLQRPT